MDYEFHLNSRQLSALWNDEDEEDSVPPLFEDPDEIDRMIEEEMGANPRRKRRRRIY